MSKKSTQSATDRTQQILSHLQVQQPKNAVADASYVVTEQPMGTLRHVRIITIGAGASGINMAYQIKKHMKNVEHVVYEKNPSVGGTWFENRYPGCKCDIPSHNYQFAWNLKTDWSAFFAPHDEILQYLEASCDKFQLRGFFKTRHAIVGARWNEEEGMWRVKIFDEEKLVEFEDSCHFLVDGSGILNKWKWPEIEGLHSFKGDLVHSADWPKNLDLQNKRVAVLGTGSSGVQIVPAILPDVQKLVHVIRSPTWVLPKSTEAFAKASNTELSLEPFSESQKKSWGDNPAVYLKFIKDIEHVANQRFKLVINGTPDQVAFQQQAKFYMEFMLSQTPSIRDILVPDFPLGCRRLTPAVGYLEAFASPKMQVVTDGIAAINADSIVTTSGTTILIDALICATGFDVSFVPRFPIIGRKNNLQDTWRDHLPRSYLSIAVPDCPNFFKLLGPNAPIGHGSALTIVEHASKYILKMIIKAQSESIKSFVPLEAAVDDFGEHIDAFMPRTAWAGNCRSWFKNGKAVGPVTALHPGSRIHWFHMLEQPRFEDYEWQHFTKNRFQYFGNGFSTKEGQGEDDTWYLNNPDVL